MASAVTNSDKTKATLFAAFALAGRTVHPTAGGGFVVTGPHSRHHVRDLEALQSLARRIGVA